MGSKVASLADFYKNTRAVVYATDKDRYAFEVMGHNGNNKITSLAVLDKIVAGGYSGVLVDHSEIAKVIEFEFNSNSFEAFQSGPLNEEKIELLKRSVNYEIGCDFAITTEEFEFENFGDLMNMCLKVDIENVPDNLDFNDEPVSMSYR